mmetsp:Transcript_96051/g.132118  ORF Transcript_96051/g.132118 Transcript_96051/m.132118 type:complete len:163 (-) Transcript_96051:86-574(-)
MFAARMLRASKMVVGVNVADVEGAKAAMKRAISLAQANDKIISLCIPQIVPEMMLSSMSDPGDASEETFSAIANLPSRAGSTLQAQLKEMSESMMKQTGKEVNIAYTTMAPASDIKKAMLIECKKEGADILFVGAGDQALANFAASRANGMTVCIVRDHVSE